MKTLVNEAPNLSDINFSEELSQFADPRPGLYLFSGRTGSGKSTAIAAIFRSAIEKHGKRIVTVEDPVEFYYPAGARVTHIEVGLDVEDFPAGVARAVEEKPDIILVGELLGAETIRAAMDAAASGCAVFAAVHAASVEDARARIVEAFSPDDTEEVEQQLTRILRMSGHLEVERFDSRPPSREIVTRFWRRITRSILP